MKITNVKIENFRLLKEVEINIDKTTTAIVGKNNTGKTSFTKLFDIFINDRKFSFDDFPLKSYVIFEEIINDYQSITDDNKEDIIKNILKKIPKITLLVEIEYDKTDNWSNIKPFHRFAHYPHTTQTTAPSLFPLCTICNDLNNKVK